LPCDAKQSKVLLWRVVCPSVGVCLSVTLRYCDHIAWNISRIISQLVNWVVTLYWPDIMDLFKGNRPKFWLELDGMWKSGFRHSKALISQKRGKKGTRLLLRS